jgi:hypothetical protein
MRERERVGVVCVHKLRVCVLDRVHVHNTHCNATPHSPDDTACAEAPINGPNRSSADRGPGPPSWVPVLGDHTGAKGGPQGVHRDSKGGPQGVHRDSGLILGVANACRRGP